jgi:alanyl aminopeptidase
MLERYAGRERFRDGVRRYLREHAHGTGSTPALLAAVDAAAGRDVTGPAGSFLDQPGVPLVTARLQCAASGARVELAQRRWRPRGASTPDQRWQIPVCIRWEAAGAEQERCVLLASERAELALGAACPAWILPNAGGAGYYLGSLEPPDLTALRERGLARLTPAERLSLAWAVDGARRAGALPADDELATLDALAGDDDAEVLGAVLDVVSRVADLVPAGAEPPFRRWAAARFRPALLRVGVRPRPGERGATATLRARLVEFLAVRAQDPALAPVLAEVAGERGDPDLANAMAVVDVQARGADAAAALAGDLDRELPPGERARVVYALLGHDAPALREPTRRLWRDPRLRRSDRTVWPLRETPAKALLDALAEDFDGTLALFGMWTRTRLPLALRAHCGDGQEARLEAVFGAQVARHPEMRRSYDQALERARWCAAERAADGPAVAAWIAARPSP